MNLPEIFIERMKYDLGELEFKQFIQTYEEKRLYALRVNTLKTDINVFFSKSKWELEKVEWCSNGFYYKESLEPGKSLFYQLGLIYMQEPSAMLPVEVLNPLPYERVLDLCSAPGGKTIQIAEKMENKGILYTNDISGSRLKAVARNIELFGVKNAIVTNEDPNNMSKVLFEYFDKILVDAPCSGEGMFRKDKKTLNNYGKYPPMSLVSIQKNILENAGKMLKAGGSIVYSTCTFNKMENEDIINDFLNNNLNFTNEEIKLGNEFTKTNPGIKLYPHKIKGEGHYVCKLIKKGELVKNKEVTIEDNNEAIEEFFRDNTNIDLKGKYIIRGNSVYIYEYEIIGEKKLNIMKPGWYLGDIKNNRFNPSKILIKALLPKDCKNIISFTKEDINGKKYLKGETLVIKYPKGYYFIEIEGYIAGLVKSDGNILKNK